MKDYQSLNEKSRAFENYFSIHNESQLSEFLNLFDKSKEAHIFRGLNSWKYKLYNSAQRAWFDGKENIRFENYHEWIDSEISLLRNYNNGLISNWYKGMNIYPIDLALLGFLQHYGAPTPLLDWTYNFKVALYFGIVIPNNSSDIKASDDYFSIYILKPHDHDKDYEHHLNNVVSRFFDMNYQKYGVEKITSLISFEEMKKMPYKFLTSIEVMAIPGFANDFTFKSHPVYNENGEEITDTNDGPFEYIHRSNKQNLNVISQEGLFVLNTDPDSPLEDVLNKRKYYFLTCYDINKSLIPEVNDYLQSHSSSAITKSVLFPSEEEIADKVFRMTLR